MADAERQAAGYAERKQALEPTPDAAWVLNPPSFDLLRDGSRESRFAISNGFLGVRGGRTIDRLAAGVAMPRTYVAGLFDMVGVNQPMAALVPAPDWLQVGLSLAVSPSDPLDDDVLFHHRTLEGIGLAPKLPEEWRSLAFSIQWRGRVVSLSIDNVLHTVRAVLERGEPMALRVGGEPHSLGGEALLASFGGLIVPAEAASRPASTSRARHA